MPFQKLKSFLFNFFHFNKQERNGFFVLCIIILILFGIRILMPFIIRDNNVQLVEINVSAKESSSDFKVNNAVNDDSNNLELNSSEIDKKVYNEYFVFNPNTITLQDAQRLGFSEKLSTTLMNFRNKGGRFFKPEDLKKLYGLSPKFYKELESYILIPGNHQQYKRDSVSFNTPRTFEKKTYTKTIVELNTADSIAIVYLKGIGPGFTKRIIKYRTLLGGFHSIVQLKEIYGMTDSMYMSLSSQIKLDPNIITKIPINVIDFNTLRKHPYFNFQSAQVIINYRSKHGKLTEIDIKNLGMFSEDKLKLILPYLSY